MCSANLLDWLFMNSLNYGIPNEQCCIIWLRKLRQGCRLDLKQIDAAVIL